MAQSPRSSALLGRFKRAVALLVGGVIAATSALGGTAAAADSGDDYEAWYREPIPIAQRGDRSALVSAAARNGVTMELPTLSVTDWSPESVIAALREADGGMMIRPADLVEAMFGDDRVQGVLSTRTLGLLGLPLQYFGEPGMVAELRGTEALGGAPGVPGDFSRMYPVAELAKLAMWGILLGLGLGERVPDEERAIGERSAPRLKIWHPRWLRYQWFDDTWWLTTKEGEIQLDLTSGRWILYLPYGAHRPWAYGAWRAIALPWILKQFALRDRARHSEVLGSAARVGTAPAGATEQQRRSWLADIKRMARDHAAVMPAGYTISMVEASATARGEIYTTSIEWADRAIAITIAGQFVTTEGTKGFSNGEIHAQIRYDLIQFTAESLSECLYRNGLIFWAIDNHGTTAAPFVRWDCTPPEDKQALATAYGALGDAIQKLDTALAASAKRVDAVAIVSKFGIPIMDLATPAAAPAPKVLPEGAALTDSPDTDPPADDAAKLLAESMTEHQIPRCEHGSVNRCRLCGIERTRSFTPGTKGSPPTWHVAWRPIAKPPAAAAVLPEAA